jgi:DNA-binding NarL/FixJ family response regulator
VVGEAASGREALEQAKALQPDVAILDVTMPELDGLQAAREIRQAAPKTKVLILTMHDSQQMIRRVLQAGASGYVLKSDFPRSLVDGVRSVFRDHRFFSPAVSEIVLQGFLSSSEVPEKIQSSASPTRKPTQREVQIIRLLAAGKSNKEVAVDLGMAVRTVETHRTKIMLKLGFSSLAHLTEYAFRNELIKF